MIADKKDIETPADIRTMVDAFYVKVQDDPLLAPIFRDVAAVDWDTHLPIMYNFWEMMLFRTGGYAGRPMPKHMVLPIATEHFERWLALFHQTVDENFAGRRATEVKYLASRIGVTFQERMGLIE